MLTKSIAGGLAIAAFILAAAKSLQYAQTGELIDPETARRTMQVIIGLVLAFYGNYMPKRIWPSRSAACAITRSQTALRVGGWSMTLAGLTYAGLWAFAPLGFADIASMVVVLTACVVTLGYGGVMLLSCRNPRHRLST
jgi:hypothetical protein